jgi:hypothetical protein
MKDEATIPLGDYLTRTPDGDRDPLRLAWHLEPTSATCRPEQVVRHADATRAVSGLRFETLDIERSTPPGGPFDRVTLFEVVEPLEAPAAVHPGTDPSARWIVAVCRSPHV